MPFAITLGTMRLAAALELAVLWSFVNLKVMAVVSLGIVRTAHATRVGGLWAALGATFQLALLD